MTLSSDRILHVLWSFGMGGKERAVCQLVSAQRERGVDADVLVAGHDGMYGESARAVGAHVYELGQRSARDPSIWRRASGILNRYSIVHFHSGEPLLMHLASRRGRLRLFYSHRGGVRTYPVHERVRYSIIGRYLRSRFEGVSGNTRQSARAAAHLFSLEPSAVAVIYNGVDFTLLEPVRSKEDVLAEVSEERHAAIRVGTSAHLRSWKRVHLLLEAMGKLRDESVRCCIVGDGPARPDLVRLAERLHVSDRVTFTGRKEPIGDYLQLFDIFVLPSGPEEAFGNAVVEAMGVGIPAVVFSDGGGLTEHVVHGETGLVVESSSELADAIGRLARDPSLRAHLGRAGRRAVRQNYTVDRTVDEHLAWYASPRDA